jgi:hypothetical protein
MYFSSLVTFLPFCLLHEIDRSIFLSFRLPFSYALTPTRRCRRSSTRRHGWARGRRPGPPAARRCPCGPSCRPRSTPAPAARRLWRGRPGHWPAHGGLWPGRVRLPVCICINTQTPSSTKNRIIEQEGGAFLGVSLSNSGFFSIRRWFPVRLLTWPGGWFH